MESEIALVPFTVANLLETLPFPVAIFKHTSMQQKNVKFVEEVDCSTLEEFSGLLDLHKLSQTKEFTWKKWKVSVFPFLDEINFCCFEVIKAIEAEDTRFWEDSPITRNFQSRSSQDSN